MANTTSGTYTFDKSFAIDDVIMESYERIGLVGTAGNQLRSARRSLNLLFSEWGNRGIHYWAIGSTNIDLIECISARSSISHLLPPSYVNVPVTVKKSQLAITAYIPVSQ